MGFQKNGFQKEKLKKKIFMKKNSGLKNGVWRKQVSIREIWEEHCIEEEQGLEINQDKLKNRGTRLKMKNNDDVY